MDKRRFLNMTLVLCAALVLAACGGGNSNGTKLAVNTPVPLPTPGPAGTLPVPVPFDVPADVAFLGSPDEAVSRVAIATLLAGASNQALDALLIPMAGVDQSLLMLEYENARAPSTPDDASTLRGLQALPAAPFMKQFNVNRISLTIRDNAVVSQTSSVSLATFQQRVTSATAGPDLYKTVFADEPGSATDPLIRAAKIAPTIFQNRILAERFRSQVLVTTDPNGMDKAIELQPYNVKYYLDKAEMIVANGDNADHVKGQALYLLQKQASNGKIATALGPQTPEYIFITHFASALLDRALGVKSFDTPKYDKLHVEYCAQDQLAKKTLNTPLATRELCG